MSVLTSNPLLVAPSAAVPISITTTGTAWTNSSWVEFIASTPGVCAIAALQQGDQNAAGLFEVEFGVGTAGNEVAVGVWCFFVGNTGAFPASQHIQMPYPLGGIGSGVRVAVRVRNSTNSSQTLLLKLGYYNALSSDQQTTATQVYSRVPAAANGASLAANTSAWANSSYFELTSGIAGSTGWFGLLTNYAIGSSVASAAIEFDLATGGAGSETVITTIRTAIGSASPATFGGMLVELLDACYAIAANTRVAVRMRKQGTTAATFLTSGLYITNVAASNRGRRRGRNRGNPGVTEILPGGAVLLNMGNPGITIDY